MLEIDPAYAPAWAGLGANFGNKAVSGAIPPDEGFTRAREANTRALEIDPQYAPAYAGLAFVAMYGDSDFVAAAKYLERAFSLDPANARVLGNSATLLNLLGRRNEALTLRKAITRRDPVNVNALFNLGTSQLNAGRLDEAVVSYRTVLSLSPGNGIAHYQVGIAMLLKGDPNGALAEFEQEPVEVFRMIALPMAYHARGRKAESDAALAALIAKYEKDATYNIAGIHAFRREADRAFERLEQERKNGGSDPAALPERGFHGVPVGRTRTGTVGRERGVPAQDRGVLFRNRRAYRRLPRNRSERRRHPSRFQYAAHGKLAG